MFLDAYERWASDNQATRSIVARGSDAESDNLLAGGGGIAPVGIVESQINSATDHLLAWHDKCVVPGPPPSIRLSSYADYTLLRPPIEALANVVWILSPDDPVERIARSLKLANVELQHAKKLVRDLEAAGTPDPELARTFERAEPHLRAAASAAGLDPERILASRPIDQTKILRTVGAEVGGSTHETLLHWARASAHSHRQLLTALTMAERTTRADGSGPYIYAEVSTRALAVTCDLVLRRINVASNRLNRRGYTRSPREAEVNP